MISRSCSVAAIGADREAELEAQGDVGRMPASAKHGRQDALPLELLADDRPDDLGADDLEVAEVRLLQRRRPRASASSLRLPAALRRRLRDADHAPCAAPRRRTPARRRRCRPRSACVDTAARTRSTGVVCWNLTMTMVPPAKSTPSGSPPRRRSSTAPARITTQRQRDGVPAPPDEVDSWSF